MVWMQHLKIACGLVHDQIEGSQTPKWQQLLTTFSNLAMLPHLIEDQCNGYQKAATLA